MVLQKGMLRNAGHRTKTVPGSAGPLYGLEPGTSLVKQIRLQKEAERAAEHRAARRARRRKE